MKEKKQSEDLKEVYQENLEQKKAKDQEEVKKDTTNSDSL